MLSVQQITARLAGDTLFTSQLDKIFTADLTKKQGPVMLYRRLVVDFTAQELASFPIPDSKPPQDEKGNYITGGNAIYDYYPENKSGGQKIPAGYRWRDVADGLNSDNIDLKDRISRYKKADGAEKNAVPGAEDFRKLSGTQLDAKQEAARSRQNVYRTNVKRAFQFHLQTQRIAQDYPGVIVELNVNENATPEEIKIGDETVKRYPLNETPKCVFIIDASKPRVGEAMTVASFLRLDVDKALRSVEAGRNPYDALLESAAPAEEPEDATDTGGDGIATFGKNEWQNVIATGAATVETHAGSNTLNTMLTEKDNDAFLLSFGKLYYWMEAHMKGSVAKKYARLLEEEQAAEEADKDRRKAELEAALASDKAKQRGSADNTAAIS